MNYYHISIVIKGVGIVMRLISRKSEKDILKVKLYCISKAYEDEDEETEESEDE